eukprot:s2917_g1.t1
MGDMMQKAYCVLSFLEAHRCAREELPRFFHGDDAQVQQQVASESSGECSQAEEMLKERGLLTSADASKLGHHVQSELLTLLHRPKNEWLALKDWPGPMAPISWRVMWLVNGFPQET